MKKTVKNDKNRFFLKKLKYVNQLFKKIKKLNFNFHNHEVPSSNLGLDTKTNP